MVIDSDKNVVSNVLDIEKILPNPQGSFLDYFLYTKADGQTYCSIDPDTPVKKSKMFQNKYLHSFYIENNLIYHDKTSSLLSEDIGEVKQIWQA
jgi:hypothetical protein